MSKLSEKRLIEWVRHWQGYRYSGMLENADAEEKQEAGEQIVALIQKPEVTEEWYNEKAKMFTTLMYNLTQHEPHLENHHFNQLKVKDFIRSLVEEMPAKKPTVTEEFVQEAIDYIAEYPSYKRLEKKLKEAGVEVVKK